VAEKANSSAGPAGYANHAGNQVVSHSQNGPPVRSKAVHQKT